MCVCMCVFVCMCVCVVVEHSFWFVKWFRLVKVWGTWFFCHSHHNTDTVIMLHPAVESLLHACACKMSVLQHQVFGWIILVTLFIQTVQNVPTGSSTGAQLKQVVLGWVFLLWLCCLLWVTHENWAAILQLPDSRGHEAPTSRQRRGERAAWAPWKVPRFAHCS